MKSDIERLKVLLRAADENAVKKGITDYKDALADNAEFLLASGVLVPPCGIGDKFYSVIDWSKIGFVRVEDDGAFIDEGEVVGVCYEGNGRWYVESKDGELWEVGTPLCLLDRAEAEKLLKERKNENKV